MRIGIHDASASGDLTARRRTGILDGATRRSHRFVIGRRNVQRT
jgi:hypothetical protein